MKTNVLFAHDGGVQVVLTPETDGEKTMLKLIKPGSTVTVVEIGDFGRTQGGYYREFDTRPNNNSIALVIEPKPTASASEGNG